eukprot:UN05186
MNNAKTADVVIYFVGTDSTEGEDRTTLDLPKKDTDLISSIGKTVNKNIIVVITNPGAVLLPFESDVKAILMTWLPGQEFGNSVADILLDR